MNTNGFQGEMGIVVLDPEEPLKSERVEEALQEMPDWTFDPHGQTLSLGKDLPTPEVAALYTAYVTGFAGREDVALTLSVAGGLVLVTLYGKRYGDKVGLTASVLDFARQIG